MNDLVTLELTPPLATMRLNRPEKMNALTPKMLIYLEASIDRIEQQKDVNVVLLTAVGEKAFCVGADINAWASLEPLDMWREWVGRGHRVFNRLAACRQPVIAALNGFTMGGGLELALAADLRLVVDSARFAMPEVEIATAPSWAGSQRLPQAIGLARAKQMLFTGCQIDAVTAERWGLINEICRREELLPRAIELAQEIADNAPLSVQMVKQIVSGENKPMVFEALVGALVASSEDGREGIASFREKRPTNYQGK